MKPIHPELLIRLRLFAKEPGALFIPLSTRRGPVPIWAEDINEAKTDAELAALINSCTGEHRGSVGEEH